MYVDGLVFGLVPAATAPAPVGVTARLRDLTIAWSRYGYHGEILEAPTVDALLAQALERGASWCLVQRWGHILTERRPRPGDAPARFEDWVEVILEDTDALFLGRITGDAERGHGIDERCFLVDLRRYEALGRPAFGAVTGEAVERPAPRSAARLIGRGAASLPSCVLFPTHHRARVVPTLPGWHLLDAALSAGLPVHDLGPVLDRCTTWLVPDDLEGCLGDRLGTLTDQEHAGLPEFLADVHDHLQNARRGIFVWNVEAYDDVLAPPAGFEPPLSTLYSVASGFKPNFILHALGFDEDTRVVFFDYSEQALRAKRLLLEHWDGEDFPRFLRQLLGELPEPEAHYHLWSGTTSATLAPRDVREAWASELDRWGGERAFQRHWRRYRGLRHEFVHCDLLGDGAPLLEWVAEEPDAAIWWSNAFFTVSGNWRLPAPERQRRYGAWIEALAQRNPDLFLYGSDPSNTAVNQIRAAEYDELLGSAPPSDLTPLEVTTCQIRF